MANPHLYTVEGIILRKRNIRDIDRIYTIFTKEYGKIHVCAKGIRKITSKRAGHLELFHQVKLTLHKGYTFDIITEAASVACDDTFGKDLRAITFGYIICELVDKLLPDKQEHTDVFYLLEQVFRQLSTDHDLPEAILDVFTTRLLHILGYLERSRTIAGLEAVSYVENIIEKRLHARVLLTRLSASTIIMKS